MSIFNSSSINSVRNCLPINSEVFSMYLLLQQAFIYPSSTCSTRTPSRAVHSPRSSTSVPCVRSQSPWTRETFARAKQALPQPARARQTLPQEQTSRPTIFSAVPARQRFPPSTPRLIHSMHLHYSSALPLLSRDSPLTARVPSSVARD